MNFLIIEYAPHIMECDKAVPVRIDGHYKSRKMAEEIAELWGRNPMHPETRIAVVEVKHVVKDPAHWLEAMA